MQLITIISTQFHAVDTLDAKFKNTFMYNAGNSVFHSAPTKPFFLQFPSK